MLSVALVCLVLLKAFAVELYISADNYEYWCVGNCSQDVVTSTIPGTVLSGGGTDVAEAFKQQLEWSGAGDFLVLRTSGTDAYNDWIYSLGPCNSVATLLLKNKAASSESFVLSKLKTMEALFFAGGDQATYVGYWTGTPLQDAILARVKQGIPVGGTSAGLAILGQWVYTALYDSVTSKEALSNPYNKRVTLGPTFIPLPFLQQFITDTHFVERDRMGRLVTFVARLIADRNATSVYGIGVDSSSSVLVDQSGIGRVVGNSDACVAYVIHSNDVPACAPGVPLTYRNILTFKLRKGDQYDFVRHTATGPSGYLISVNKGVLPNPY